MRLRERHTERTPCVVLCSRTESERRRFDVGGRTVEGTVVEGNVEGTFVGIVIKVMDVHKLVSFVHYCTEKFK